MQLARFWVSFILVLLPIGTVPIARGRKATRARKIENPHRRFIADRFIPASSPGASRQAPDNSNQRRVQQMSDFDDFPLLIIPSDVVSDWGRSWTSQRVSFGVSTAPVLGLPRSDSGNALTCLVGGNIRSSPLTDRGLTPGGSTNRPETLDCSSRTKVTQEQNDGKHNRESNHPRYHSKDRNDPSPQGTARSPCQWALELDIKPNQEAPLRQTCMALANMQDLKHGDSWRNSVYFSNNTGHCFDSTLHCSRLHAPHAPGPSL